MKKNDLIEINKEFLQKSDLVFDFYSKNREREEFIINDTGEREVSGHLISIESHIVLFGDTKVKLKNNLVSAAVLIFGMFDTYIDMTYPKCSGVNFSEKYRILKSKSKNDFDIIQREIYRIFKLIRNALTHNIDKIIINNEEVTIDYKFTYDKKNNRKTHFRLKINNSTLQLIYTTALLIMDNDIEEKRGYEFKVGLLAEYYAEIKNNIEIQDEQLRTLEDISHDIILIKRKRYDVSDEQPYEFNKNNEMITITKYKKEFSENESIDYRVNFGGKKYIVPEEYLDTSNSIHVQDIKKWEIKI